MEEQLLQTKGKVESGLTASKAHDRPSRKCHVKVTDTVSANAGQEFSQKK
jgi:hypothetical protein